MVIGPKNQAGLNLQGIPESYMLQKQAGSVSSANSQIYGFVGQQNQQRNNQRLSQEMGNNTPNYTARSQQQPFPNNTNNDIHDNNNSNNSDITLVFDPLNGPVETAQDTKNQSHINLNNIPQQNFQYSPNQINSQQQHLTNINISTNMNMNMKTAIGNNIKNEDIANNNNNNNISSSNDSIKIPNVAMPLLRSNLNIPYIPGGDSLGQNGDLRNQVFPQQDVALNKRARNKSMKQNEVKTSQNNKKLKNNFQVQPGLSNHRSRIPTPINIDPKNNNNNWQSTPNMKVPIASFPYPVRKYLSNMAAIKFHEMIDMINMSAGRITQTNYWQRCMNLFFSSDAILRYSKTSSSEIRQFDFLVPLIPLIFVTLGRLGVVRIEIIALQLKTELLSNGSVFFDCPRCTFTYHYPDGSYITHFIQLKGLFNSNLKIEWGDLYMHSFVPGIEWNSLERLVSNNFTCFDIFQKLSNPPDVDSKTGIKNELQNQQNDFITLNSSEHQNFNKTNPVKSEPNPESFSNNEGASIPNNLPPNFAAITQLRSYFNVFRNVSVFGSQEGLMRVMQVSTVMSSLKHLRMYQKLHNIDSPLIALKEYVKHYKKDIPASDFLRKPQDPTHNSGSHASNEGADRSFIHPNTMNYMNLTKSSTPTDTVSPSSQESHKLSSQSSQTSERRLPSKKRRASGISPHSRETSN